MDELGKKLLEQRQARGISLQEISTATHISIGVLKDIENGNFAKYEGDEEYIKKYLKKYADYLGIESDELVDSYVTLTREISLSKIQEREEKIKSEPKKQVKMTQPAFTRTSKVYDNHSGRTFAKYAIIVVLCLLIVVSVWYGLQLTNDSNTDFGNQNQTHVSGNPEPSVPEDSDAVADEGNTTEPEAPVEEEETVKVEHTGEYAYTITIPQSMESFDFRIDFVSRTWSSLTVNGQAYSGFEAKIYNSTNTANDANATPETVTMNFNKADVNTIELTNGFNLNHRYYINDTEISVPAEENNGQNHVLTFTFVKE